MPLISASLLSLLAVGVSVYLALFAGRSLLPGPLAGTATMEAPRVSVNVPAPATTPAGQPAPTQVAPGSDAPSARPLATSFILQAVTPPARTQAAAAPVPAVEARRPEPAAAVDLTAGAAGTQKNHAIASAESPDKSPRLYESSKKTGTTAGNGNGSLKSNDSSSGAEEAGEASRPAADSPSTKACRNHAGGKSSRR
ncbi:MAG: hypothetical protein ACYCXU_06435 [Thermoleophilia bacterium]